MYDLIGDIHGYAGPLQQLLKKLGYTRHKGAYRHPGRLVVFLGDFIDRGPQIRETLEIVRAMIDSGAALSFMGNHELNALAFHTPDPKNPSEHLRPHNEKNSHQLLTAVENGDAGPCVAAVENDSAQPCSSRSRMGRGVSPVPSPFQREAQECTATWRSGLSFGVSC
jgi:hypothetical protein